MSKRQNSAKKSPNLSLRLKMLYFFLHCWRHKRRFFPLGSKWQVWVPVFYSPWTERVHLRAGGRRERTSQTGLTAVVFLHLHYGGLALQDFCWTANTVCQNTPMDIKVEVFFSLAYYQICIPKHEVLCTYSVTKISDIKETSFSEIFTN